MKKHFLLLLFIPLVYTGCYYDNEEELYPQAPVDTTVVITYSGDIQPLIANNCAIGGCHVAGAQIPDLSDYAKLKANIDRVEARAVNADPGPMPAAGLMSVANRTKLKTWIDKGALNN
jgi:hypothetical protein